MILTKKGLLPVFFIKISHLRCGKEMRMRVHRPLEHVDFRTFGKQVKHSVILMFLKVYFMLPKMFLNKQYNFLLLRGFLLSHGPLSCSTPWMLKVSTREVEGLWIMFNSVLLVERKWKELTHLYYCCFWISPIAKAKQQKNLPWCDIAMAAASMHIVNQFTFNYKYLQKSQSVFNTIACSFKRI